MSSSSDELNDLVESLKTDERVRKLARDPKRIAKSLKHEAIERMIPDFHAKSLEEQLAIRQSIIDELEALKPEDPLEEKMFGLMFGLHMLAVDNLANANCISVTFDERDKLISQAIKLTNTYVRLNEMFDRRRERNKPVEVIEVPLRK